MNKETAKILCKLNNDFYRSQAVSFSDTRKAPWEGWKQALGVIAGDLFKPGKTLKVLDIACGNLRFVDYLFRDCPNIDYEIYAVDNCSGLVPRKSHVRYQNLDITAALLEETSLAEALEAPLCDLVVCFGFMHHVPSADYRRRVIDALIDKTREGGYLILSFWEFLNNEALAEKARNTHEQARRELAMPPLEEGDYLLGWKNMPGVYRYCHNFSEGEIDNLLEDVSGRVQVTIRFSADGRSGNLNSYVVLRRL